MHNKVDLFSLLNINVSEFQSVDNVTRGQSARIKGYIRMLELCTLYLYSAHLISLK